MRKVKVNLGGHRRLIGREDRALIREIYREHLAQTEELLKIERQLLDLMCVRDDLRRQLAQTSVRGLAEKWEVGQTVILNIVKPRSTTQI